MDIDTDPLGDLFSLLYNRSDDLFCISLKEKRVDDCDKYLNSAGQVSSFLSCSELTYFKSLLYCAARYGCPNAVKLLIAMGSDVNSKEKTAGSTPLHGTRSKFVSPSDNILGACWGSYDECAKILIENGANISSRNHHGETPMVSDDKL